MRSAVPLPCFFDVEKSRGVAGQRPQQGTKSCRMGRNSVRPSVHPSICPHVHPSFSWSTCFLSKGSDGQLEGSGGQPAGSEGQPEGGRAEKRTDKQTEFLPILQDFVPSRGRCPKTNNQSPKGIMRAVVPLPCFFDVVMSQRVAGQWPNEGTKSCRMVRNSVCLSIHLSFHTSICLSIYLFI